MEYVLILTGIRSVPESSIILFCCFGKTKELVFIFSFYFVEMFFVHSYIELVVRMEDMKGNIDGGVVRYVSLNGEWCCPFTVLQFRDGPLYQAVVYWALQEGRWITTRDVSDAFAITTRKARDVLHYITHNVGLAVEVDISVKKRFSDDHHFVPRGHGWKAIYVREVHAHLFPQNRKQIVNMRQGKVKPVSVCRKRSRLFNGNTEILALRKWFVSRRLGEPVPVIWATE